MDEGGVAVAVLALDGEVDRLVDGLDDKVGRDYSAWPDRLDLVAFRYFQDPEQFWRICDANGALWPDDLLEPGNVLLIPASEGP